MIEVSLRIVEVGTIVEDPDAAEWHSIHAKVPLLCRALSPRPRSHAHQDMHCEPNHEYNPEPQAGQIVVLPHGQVLPTWAVCCRVIFWDGTYLDVYEVVSTELGYPVRIHDAYTYIRDGQRFFRYDNAPHHPEKATHPQSQACQS